MKDGTLGIASDFVRSGIEKTGIPLTQSLEAYLAITFARFIGKAIGVDMLTIRIAKASAAASRLDPAFVIGAAPGKATPRVRLGTLALKPLRRDVAIEAAPAEGANSARGPPPVTGR